MNYDLIVIGGGAAGFYTAIQCAEQYAAARILILEKSAQVLGKVRVSGGGRCNVTHGCFDPAEMVEHYPRGRKELLGPFHRFLCGDMMGWLDDHRVPTKIESDGRVFPVSNSSQTIIDCFLDLCNKHHIEVRTKQSVHKLHAQDGHWEVSTEAESLTARHVLCATGSSPAMWRMLGEMGYNIIDPVPSLFTFNISDPMITGIPGIAVPDAEVSITGTGFEANGPLLITHWGLSGPAVLKLSAWAARELHELNYIFRIAVNWTGLDRTDVREVIETFRQESGKALLDSTPLLGLPKRLWRRMVAIAEVGQMNFASLRNDDINCLLDVLTRYALQVNGKSTFKEEFVTCGGVDTREVHFKTMESKLHPGLYFAGEVLNIDAVTGGFNFQACWTEAYIAAEAIAKSGQPNSDQPA